MAATACAPPALRRCVTPAFRAQYSTSGLMEPSCRGGVGEHERRRGQHRGAPRNVEPHAADGPRHPTTQHPRHRLHLQGLGLLRLVEVADIGVGHVEGPAGLLREAGLGQVRRGNDDPPPRGARSGRTAS